MALTSEQKSNFFQQLEDLKKKLEGIKKQAIPSGQVAGASTSNLNPAQLGGASGVGFEDDETQDVIADQVSATLDAGGSKSQAGDSINPRQSASIVGQYNLGGIIDPASFVGLTVGQAASKARQEQQKRSSQVSQGTSFAFNPETLTRTQRAVDKLGFALDEAGNDPYEPNEFKEDNKKSAVELTQKEIGQLFNDPNDLLNAYNTNPSFQATIDNLIKNGGSVEGISKNISATAVAGGQQVGPDGESNVAKDSFNMIAGINNPQVNQEAQKTAIEELIPESQVAQAEIARQAQIPEDLMTLYFGDEKSLGILDMRKNQATEEIKLLEEQEKDAKRTARERASLQVDKNRAEVKKARASIEENRLRAKNYMTGALAKLGALKTTGAAPLALQTLETKYQGQITSLETSYEFANREIEIGLDETLDGIDNKADNLILGIQQDLTNDTEKVTKEILKAQQAAEKETYRITEQYARRLRTRTAKYTADLKKAAEKYAKEFAKTAGGDLKVNKFAQSKGEGAYLKNKGVLRPDGTFSDLRLTPTQQREIESSNVLGDDTMRYFLTLPKAFRDELSRGQLSSGQSLHTIDAVRPLFEEWVRLNEEEDDDGGDDVF